ITSCDRATSPDSSATTNPAAAATPYATTEPSAPTTQPLGKIVRSDEEWQRLLTPEQYRVTRLKGTERPFSGAYWDNHEAGEYHCVACDLDLFHSDTKFESGTGWPSFWSPAAAGHVATQTDSSFGMDRNEVLCPRCG